LDYKDYYASLGVGRDATASEIQKAYRKLARKLHPDVNKTPDAETRFKEITEAYEVLKSPDKRAKYDQFGSAWKQAQNTGAPPPGFEDIFEAFRGGGGGGGFDVGGGGGGFSSFFEALFGGGRPGEARGFQWSTRPGMDVHPPQDHEATISLSLEEAAAGGQRQIQIHDPVSRKRKTLKVKIPPGVRAGQRIRLGGQGGGAAGDGRRGDLYLRVEVLPHPRFQLVGDQLVTQLDVTPSEAALGGEAEVQTLKGPVRVRIPAGSSSGRKIRLRGKGFPAAVGNGGGDLIAEIRVVVPSELSDAERDLYRQLSDLSTFRPRAEETH
jgi:curved DNA-binding protein